MIEEARVIGYQKMRLDTLPEKMPQAVALYQKFGFRPIAAYYDNPHEETLFMEKEIGRKKEKGKSRVKNYFCLLPLFLFPF